MRQAPPPARECIISGSCVLKRESLPEVTLSPFVSGECGATAMSTGAAIFASGARLPYHKHSFSEAVTVLEGEALITVEGRCYHLRPFDCIHIPSGIAHEVVNASNYSFLTALWAFASPTPSRELVQGQFAKNNRSATEPEPDDPEHVVWFKKASAYELATGTEFCDLFAGHLGAVGICGGYGKFRPGSSLPCHVHDYDESITIVQGEATCEVGGKRYHLSGCDTAFVPAGRPHRFLNESSNPMAMVWVYAGDEPARTIVDVGRCSGWLEREKP
ncbi:MAG: cupin domain-containing protein [Nitrososphaerales archaeon]